jgi:hypothetical protein
MANCRLRRAAWRWRAAALCLVAGWPLITLAQDSTTPVQLRRIGLGQPAGMKDPIGASVEACRAARQLPPGPVTLPPDTALAKLVVYEEEEFFDGGRWASYVTQRSVRADPSHRECQVAVFVHRSVSIEQTCDSRLHGATPPIAELSDPAGPRPPTFELRRSAASRAGCGRKAKDEDVTGLPVQDASGTPCVWSSDLQAKMMRQAGLKAQGHDDQGAFDTCVYLRQPSHVYQGHRRKIVLKTSGSDRTLSGADLAQISGEAKAYSHQQLASFSAGTPVPAGRFTEASAEAFLKRPAKTGLGDGT